MKNYIPVIKNNPLFRGVTEEDLLALMGCMQARVQHYEKGEYLFRREEGTEYVTLLLEGRVHIQNDDYWGNRSIISIINPGEIFGEAFALQPNAVFTNDAVAVEDSTVVFLYVKKMLTTCSACCSFHHTVIRNMFLALSEKNRRLVQKLEHMSKRSTREKLLSYLSEQSRLHASSSFTIPFNRQQLADFLSVDRSAMSNELCKLRDEGMLQFSRSHFTLIQ